MFSILSTLVWPQTFAHAQVTDNQAVYRSEIDSQLTIHKVTVLPFIDNVQGIYSRPLENDLTDSLKKSHRFDFVEVNTAGPMMTPEDFEQDPEAVGKLSGAGVDGFFVGRVTKGPNGMALSLYFFLTQDKKLFAKAEIRDYPRADINALKDQTETLMNQILQKIPYGGLVLSRQGNRVTVNLGRRDGVQNDQVVTVIQIIKVNRHPKFNFIINSEKEILGRVKLVKIDETLSFGMILAEKEKGAIQKNSKIASLDFVTYPDSSSLTQGTTPEDQVSQRTDGNLIFGKDAKPWVPRKPPTFGQVGARLGLGNYQTDFKQSSQALDAKSSLYPAVMLEGEVWVTQEYSMHAGLKQAVIPIGNPKTGSSPSSLNQSLSYYEFLFGYNWRLGGGLWGPHVEALVGYSTYRLYVDDSSPRAFTTLEYAGIKFGLDGSFPVTNDGLWHAGAKLFLFWNPKMTETPVTSGYKATGSINQFSFYGFYKFRENIKLIGSLDIELYSSSFSGTGTSTDPATSVSQKHTTLTGGIQYMF